MVRLLSYSLPALWLAVFPFRGKLRPGGFLKLFVSITSRVRGTRTPETASTEASSSPFRLGTAWVGMDALIFDFRENSSTELFLSGRSEAGLKIGPTRLESAGSDE